MERSLVNGELWLTVPGASAGRPIAGWRVSWNKGDIELERRVDDNWVAFEKQEDWGVFNAKEA